MEREVSSATMLGVSMCALGAFIAVVLLTVRIGDTVKADAYNSAVEIQIRTESGTLKELRGQDKEMSIAAIFGIIQNGYDYIGNIDVSRIMEGTGWGTGTTKEESMRYIQNNMSGRARLAVEYDTLYGGYNLIIHKSNCSDAYTEHDVCN